MTFKKTAAFTAALSAAAIMALYVSPASSQPPAGGPGGASGASGGRGRGGGGGFTHAAKEDFNDHEGFTQIFDGKSLNGWDGDMNLWSLKDGAMYIASTCEKPTGTVYMVWQGGEVGDFDLRLEMKGTGSINGGVQYRSWITSDPNAPQQPGRGGAGGGGRGGSGGFGAGRGPGGGSGGFGGGRGPAGPCPSGQPRGTAPDRASQTKWDMGGPQYDFDNNNQYPGQLYEQATGRGIIAWKGEVVETMEGGKKQLLASLGDVAPFYNKDDWNTIEIIAIGNTMTHLMNGHLMSVTIDNEKSRFHPKGKIGIEVEATGELFTRNVWLKKY
jgi:hypothetical protein